MSFLLVNFGNSFEIEMMIRFNTLESNKFSKTPVMLHMLLNLTILLQAILCSSAPVLWTRNF